MNEFIEYVCRGVIRSEDAIKHLNRKVASLTKCHRNLATSLICFGISGILLTLVVAEQDKEIRALKKQVDGLKEPVEEVNAVDTADTTEEQNEQEGA